MSAVAIVLKGYPRLSETFIAQELLELQGRGLEFEIWSLRKPYDKARHPMHEMIKAQLFYLPEYLHREPLRVLKGLRSQIGGKNFGRLLKIWLKDFMRDPTPNRVRRLGQAFVMARELSDQIRHMHVHYLHTPSSVVRYCAILRDLPWSFSAHAKDIWTIPDWEAREKIAASAWGVTCTREGHGRLASLSPPGEARVSLAYHGLDLSRFPAPPESRPARDGGDPADPAIILTIGRAVAKKGFDDLLSALALLPKDLNWRLRHIGGGKLSKDLKKQADALGFSDRVEWLGARPQGDVIAALRMADLFVLPSRPAPDGDRDGLPNVLMEAASQRLAIVSTDFAGVPEFAAHDIHALLAPPQDPPALAAMMERVLRDPALRSRLGRAAEERLRKDFDMKAGIDLIAVRLPLGPAPSESHADRLLRAPESA